jgi:hypothetical protein
MSGSSSSEAAIRLACGVAALLVMAGSAAEATEDGGSLYPVGVATVVPGVTPVPPPGGLSYLNYTAVYIADRANDSDGNKALPRFRLDAMATTSRFDYTLPWTTWGICWGLQLIVPLARISQSMTLANGRTVKGTAEGFADITIHPVMARWDLDTPAGPLKQWAGLQITPPTASYDARQTVNLGRNYTAYVLRQGTSWFPTPELHMGYQLNYAFNDRNGATDYLSGQELILEYVGSYALARRAFLELQGYVYEQTTPDLQYGRKVDGDGHYGRAFAIGPQFRYIFEPGAIAFKWQQEFGVENRAQGERFWVHFQFPL